MDKHGPNAINPFLEEAFNFKGIPNLYFLFSKRKFLKEDYKKLSSVAKEIISSRITSTSIIVLFAASAAMQVICHEPTCGQASAPYLWLIAAISNAGTGIIAGYLAAVLLQFFRAHLLLSLLFAAIFMTAGSGMGEVFYTWCAGSSAFHTKPLLLIAPINIMTAVLYWMASRRSLTSGSNSHRAAPCHQSAVCPKNDLLQLLPLHLRGKILLARARGHYVEIVTDKGPWELRLRFSDAIKQLDGHGGLRVHRSHWVRAEILQSLEKDGNRYFVHTSVGRIPVSPKMAKEATLLSCCSRPQFTAKDGSP